VQNNEGAEGNANGEPGIEPRSEDEVQPAAARKGSKAAKKEARRAAGEDTQPKAKVENVPSNAGPMYEVPFILCRQTTTDISPVPNGPPWVLLFS
jgi:hypothetical protein